MYSYLGFINKLATCMKQKNHTNFQIEFTLSELFAIMTSSPTTNNMILTLYRPIKEYWVYNVSGFGTLSLMDFSTVE